MEDIRNRSDIDTLVKTFYSKVLNDDLIGFLFTDVARLNLEHHLPIIADFWEMVLLGSPTYQKNPIPVHLALNSKSPLLPEHFARWLQLWQQTVDELFIGNVAEQAKIRAMSIATVMQTKIWQGRG